MDDRATNDARARAAERMTARLRGEGCRCGVIGLGFIGSTLMDALIAAGVEAHGVDRDPVAVDRFLADHAQGTPAPERWSVGSDPAVLSDSDAVFVAVRLPVAANGEVDVETLRSVASVLRSLPGERLVLLESTVPPGTTRRFASWLGERADLFVAHSPERLAVGHDWQMLKGIPHLVAGVDAQATRLAEAFLRRICDTVVPVSSPEVTELSKLLENAFLSVGIALVGEVTRLAHDLGVSAREVSDAAATKPFGYYAFYPGPGVGGHCLPNDLRMLAEVARAAGKASPLLEAAITANAEHASRVVDRLDDLLRRNGSTLRSARVLCVGMGFKPGSPDTTATPAVEVMRLLRARGAEPLYVDSRVASFEVDSIAVPRLAPAELATSRISAVLVLAGDPELSEQQLPGKVVLDAGGGAVLAGGLRSAHRL
jgi:UDP-N-acetyl-D-glucosamine dehydrogenase